MTKKPKKTKELTEAELEAVNAQITARKKELFNELIRAVARPGGLDDLEAVATRFDAAGRQEDALNRVHGTIGMLMMHKAQQNKAKRGNGGKDGKG
jgi:hypothetical protein